ncbi:MAG: hypothetical protein ABSC29_02225 [Minisyncoccia bacterium]
MLFAVVGKDENIYVLVRRERVRIDSAVPKLLGEAANEHPDYVVSLEYSVRGAYAI